MPQRAFWDNLKEALSRPCRLWRRPARAPDPAEGPRWRHALWRALWLLLIASPFTLLVIRYVTSQRTYLHAWLSTEMALHGAFYLYGSVMVGLGMGMVAFCASRWAGAEHERGERLAADSTALENIAHTDSLTGLLNRGTLLDQIREEIGRANRYQHSVASLFVDVDDFKDFNEKHGHLFGDQVLRRVTDALRASVRESDTLGRYGGDEFLLLMPYAKIPAAQRVAERIRENIGRIALDTPAGEPARITVSIGVMADVPRGADVARFLETADAALHRSKSLGKNRTTVWEPPPGPPATN